MRTKFITLLIFLMALSSTLDTGFALKSLNWGRAIPTPHIVVIVKREACHHCMHTNERANTIDANIAWRFWTQHPHLC